MNTVVQMRRPQAEAGTFEEWWFHYPSCRRVEKALCRQLWESITGPGLHTRMQNRDSGQYVNVSHQAPPEELLDAVRRYDQRMLNATGTYGSYKDDGKYVMRPSTWLNRGCWED